jgi:hypothetical protein
MWSADGLGEVICTSKQAISVLELNHSRIGTIGNLLSVNLIQTGQSSCFCCTLRTAEKRRVSITVDAFSTIVTECAGHTRFTDVPGDLGIWNIRLWSDLHSLVIRDMMRTNLSLFVPPGMYIGMMLSAPFAALRLLRPVNNSDKRVYVFNGTNKIGF